MSDFFCLFVNNLNDMYGRKKSYVKVDTAPDNVYSTGIFFKENLPLNISALHSFCYGLMTLISNRLAPLHR